MRSDLRGGWRRAGGRLVRAQPGQGEADLVMSWKRAARSTLAPTQQ